MHTLLLFDEVQGMAVYPNPVETGEKLQLLLGNRNVRSVQIFDNSRRKRYESFNIEDGIKIQDLPTGRYIIKITMKDGSENSHVFVKK